MATGERKKEETKAMNIGGALEYKIKERFSRASLMES